MVRPSDVVSVSVRVDSLGSPRTRSGTGTGGTGPGEDVVIPKTSVLESGKGGEVTLISNGRMSFC